jgi:type I restriction enzyme M protein
LNVKATKTVAAEIAETEGFNVRFVSRDGSDITLRRVDEYDYARAARNQWTVARWREARFAVMYPDFEVEVLDANGISVPAETILSTVRGTYMGTDDAPRPDGDACLAQPPVEHQGEQVAVEPGAGSRSTNPPATLTQQSLESRLWAAANSLRGPVDAGDFKAYIFPLLVFKRISDNWDGEHDQALDDYDDLIDDEVEADYHRFVVPEGCHWDDLRRLTENVGVGLQRILDRIQQANPTKLAAIFGDVAWGNKDKLPEVALLNLIDSFGSLDLAPARVGNDVLGAAYEYLLKQFADSSGAKAGEFFTPRAVVRLLTQILDPRPTDTVYDPACGSGGMLVEAASEVMEATGSVRQMRFYGQEVNLTTQAIARMNLFLHDIEDAEVLRGDTLRDPKFRDARGRLHRFEVVIANPPFSLKNWGGDVWSSDPWGRAFCGVPPAGNADMAWVQHMVSSMRPGTGRVGVVMPHGVLFRGGVEAKIRQCLITQDQLEAVVGLPANLFYSTTIPGCLLILRAEKRAERRGRVLFVDGSARFTKGRNQNQMGPADILAVLRAYRSGDGDVPARLVEHTEIKENGWDLNIGRYLKSAAGETLDVPTALAALNEAQAALHDAEKRLAERLKAAGYA